MKIGDKVRFLNDTGGGIITEFVDEKLVKVLTEEGFEFPVLKAEVIVVSAEPEDFIRTHREEDETDEVAFEKVELPEEGLPEEGLPEEKERTLSDYLEKKKPGSKVEIKEKKGDDEETVPDVEEVNLHIQHILPDYKDLTSGEILEAQMARFTTALEGAIRHKQKRIVFIHGKGAGKLKYELRKTLENNYPRLRFQDASFKEYGFGATMVIIP